MTAPDLADDVGSSTDKHAADSPAPSGRRRLLLGLGVLALLLLVAVVVLAVLVQRGAAAEDRREAIVTAARQSALNLTSIDNEDFDADVRLVLDGATGAFRADFESRAEELEQVLTENEVVSEGEVLETAVLRNDETTATALVVVDGDVSNTAAPEGRVNTYRMRLELELVDGVWKTSMLEFVG